MRFKDFISGRCVRQYEHQSVSPSLVNQEWTWDDPQINQLLEEAGRTLAQRDAFSSTPRMWTGSFACTSPRRPALRAASRERDLKGKTSWETWRSSPW